MFLRYAYVVFIGVLLAAFVGVGIATFYPGPKHPESQTLPKAVSPDKETPEDYAQRVEMNKKFKEFQEKEKEYNRNVSIFSLVASVIILILSLTVIKNIVVISDALLLGGIITSIYSIARGFGTDDNMYRFIVISLGLLVALFLGYIKMVKPLKTNL